jgi:hypothetical protein
MVANDNAGNLALRGVLGLIASVLVPAGNGGAAGTPTSFKDI